MVKNSRHHFSALFGDKDLAGKCGDRFTVNGSHTIQIIGYTNQGGAYLVKSISTGKIYAYVFRAGGVVVNRVKKEEKKRGRKFGTYSMSKKEYNELMNREEAERAARLKKLSKPK